MPPLAVLIMCIAAAGIVTLLGTILTIRRSQRASFDQSFIPPTVQCLDVRYCSYCGTSTDRYIGVIHNGITYDPVCTDCLYQTGICNANGSISPEFYYQVEPAARF